MRRLSSTRLRCGFHALPRIARILVEPVFGTSTKMHLYLCEITEEKLQFYLEAIAVQQYLAFERALNDGALFVVKDRLIRRAIFPVF